MRARMFKLVLKLNLEFIFNQNKFGKSSKNIFFSNNSSTKEPHKPTNHNNIKNEPIRLDGKSPSP